MSLMVDSVQHGPAKLATDAAGVVDDGHGEESGTSHEVHRRAVASGTVHELTDGERWLFCASWSVALLCMIGIGAMHKSFDRVHATRFSKDIRLALRGLVAIVILVLPAGGSMTSMEILAVTASLTSALVLGEVFGGLRVRRRAAAVGHLGRSRSVDELRQRAQSAMSTNLLGVEEGKKKGSIGSNGRRKSSGGKEVEVTTMEMDSLGEGGEATGSENSSLPPPSPTRATGAMQRTDSADALNAMDNLLGETRLLRQRIGASTPFLETRALTGGGDEVSPAPSPRGFGSGGGRRRAHSATAASGGHRGSMTSFAKGSTSSLRSRVSVAMPNWESHFEGVSEEMARPRASTANLAAIPAADNGASDEEEPSPRFSNGKSLSVAAFVRSRLVFLHDDRSQRVRSCICVILGQFHEANDTDPHN